MWKKFGNHLKHNHCNISKAKSINQIAVFGYADCDEDDKIYNDAFKVSKMLGEAGYVVVNGGGKGVMRASTLGAKAGGGCVIGVTFDAKGMTNYEGRDEKNLFDEEIYTKTYLERTLALLREGQVYVIFNGGTGTISEFGMAWGLARLYFGHHKPLILYGKFWKKIINSFFDNMRIRPEEKKVYKIVDKPEEVLDAINKFEEELERGEHKHHIEATKTDFSI